MVLKRSKFSCSIIKDDLIIAQVSAQLESTNDKHSMVLAMQHHLQVCSEADNADLHIARTMNCRYRYKFNILNTNPTF